MGEVFRLQKILTGDEGSFGQFISAPGSATFDQNLPFLEATAELQHERDPDGSSQFRLAVEAPGHKGVRRCKLRMRCYWIGHISDPTGALTETWLQRLIGDGLGGNSVGQVGGTVSAGATTTSIPFAAATLLRGGLIRLGSKGDSGGDGQVVAVGTPIVTPATLLTAAPAAPANGAVLRPCAMAYHVEGATLGTKRFYVMHKDTGAQYVLFGCQLSKLRLMTATGGKPMVEVEFEGAYWERSAGTDTMALQSHDCAPIAGGSFFWQDFATTTRALKNATEVEIMLDLGLEPIEALGGSGMYQYIVGWARTAAKATMRFKAPWETAFETWWDTENPSLVYKHALATFNVGHGRSVSAYAPRCFPMGPRPSLPVGVREQTYVDVHMGLTESTDETNDLTRSALRLGMS